jgi:mannose-1-phosphate guanylyltransferase
MVPVLNRPFLEHVIDHLSEHQAKHIVLAQGHLSPLIESYFKDGSQFGVKLNSIVENEPLGTAGAVKNADQHLDETFLVLNGDIFTDLDITAMLNFHRERKAKVTIALTPVEDPTHYGLIETDAQSKVTRFMEKPKPEQVTTNMINAGTYVMEPDVMNQIPPQTNFSFEHQLFPMLLEQGKPIYAYPSPAYWIDIGTPEKYLQLHLDLLTGKSSRYALAPGKELVIGEQSHIHPTAQIKGPAVIGSNCHIDRGVRLIGPVVIGPGCEILSEAVIEESIIWQNCRVGEHVTLKSSIVADHCHLKASSTIEGSVLGDNVTVVSGSRLEPGSKIWPEKTLEPEE